MVQATETDIRDFWNAHPCGQNLVPPDDLTDDVAFLDYLDRFDAYRYEHEGHILEMLDRFQWSGQQVLEIGLGQGADSQQLIERGARWSGVDLTPASVEILNRRLRLRGLPFEQIQLGSALDLPFADASFDYVYSFGVLHHIPEIERAQREIHRVLKPGGRALIMLYAKNSVNYRLSIGVLRRLGLLGAVAADRVGVRRSGIIGRHVELANEQGLGRYLAMDQFLHHNTDGPDNRFSRVYDRERVEQDFSQFRVIFTEQAFRHAPPIPAAMMAKLPASMGWHLWVLLEARS